MNTSPAQPRIVSGLVTAWLAVALLFPGPAAHAQTPTPREYQVKAVFLFNFIQFVEWPATVFAATNSPVTIGILGDSDIVVPLEKVLRDETIKDRPLTIKQSRRVEDMRGCQLLFVSKSEKARLGAILASVADTNTLTVGESDGFAHRGGVINFFLDANKVRFEINLEAARHQGLKLSSQLLNLGKLIAPEPGKEKE